MRASDLFERITRHIIDEIESGASRYVMPWHRWGDAIGSPVNAISGRPYRGINTLLLWAAAELDGYSSGRWATYRQWAAVGAQVRKKEKASAILFWKTAGQENSTSGEGDDERTPGPRFIARVYHVFNAAQVEGGDEALPSSCLSDDERIASAEQFFAACRARVEHGGDKACYVPSVDVIHMPKFEQFKDRQGYYSVFGHEHVHWTGAGHRLDRDLKGRFGTEAYAVEELIAELGAAFLGAQLGLNVMPRRDHAAYMASWLRVLRNDSRAILTASSKAQEAVDYLIRLQASNDIGSPSTASDARCAA